MMGTMVKAVDLVPFKHWVWFAGLDRVVCRNDRARNGKRAIMLTDPLLNVFTMTVSEKTLFEVTDDTPVSVVGISS